MNLLTSTFEWFSGEKRKRELQELREGIVRDVLGEVNRHFSLEMSSHGGVPSVTQFSAAVRNTLVANMNIKFFGYELARMLAEKLPPPSATAERYVGLGCKASVQADMESDWLAHWCAELLVPVVMHRKLWEQAFILQVIRDEGFLSPGARALGFGCGAEPLPSYFASRGLTVTISDLGADEAFAKGWSHTNQHSASLEASFQPHLVERTTFDLHVDHRIVDMTSIPTDLRNYDLCWSVCALEHLGSIEEGLAFLEASLDTLRPGGLSVHTTELNIDPEGPTFERWPTVLFQPRHFHALAERLARNGHILAPLDFELGDRPMDRFIDIPPWAHDLPTTMRGWDAGQPHLKVAVDGFVSTCFGIIIRKAA